MLPIQRLVDLIKVVFVEVVYQVMVVKMMPRKVSQEKIYPMREGHGRMSFFCPLNVAVVEVLVTSQVVRKQNTSIQG